MAAIGMSLPMPSKRVVPTTYISFAMVFLKFAPLLMLVSGSGSGMNSRLFTSY